MTDIVQRLRESATQARALDRSELLNEAADEIVKIRREVADMSGGLTDAEREAIEEAIRAFDEFAGDEVYVTALRGLLERTK